VSVGRQPEGRHRAGEGEGRGRAGGGGQGLVGGGGCSPITKPWWQGHRRSAKGTPISEWILGSMIRHGGGAGSTVGWPGGAPPPAGRRRRGDSRAGGAWEAGTPAAGQRGPTPHGAWERERVHDGKEGPQGRGKGAPCSPPPHTHHATPHSTKANGWMLDTLRGAGTIAGRD